MLFYELGCIGADNLEEIIRYGSTLVLKYSPLINENYRKTFNFLTAINF